ncbi:ribosome maturation factor RimP [Deinococcus yavapaiensis]|nr:ribosome maturation factor RimP [Deinococcus yavapaiensis]
MTQQLENIVTTVLEPLGFEVLEVHLQNPGRKPLLLVRIDRFDEQPVTIEDVHRASSALDAELDRLDPIEGEYRLEVESPGGKRPLKRARHFERMIGLKAKVRSKGHNFTAPILKVEGDDVTFDLQDGPVTLKAGEFQANLAEFPPSHR